MEFDILFYAGGALLFIYIALRIAGTVVFSKYVNDEFEHIIASEEHKVKGRFD